MKLSTMGIILIILCFLSLVYSIIMIHYIWSIVMIFCIVTNYYCYKVLKDNNE